MKKRKKKKKIPEGTEEEIQLFKELSTAITESGIETRVEKGNFKGGFCMVEGNREMLIVNKKHTMDKRIALIISELKKREMIHTVLPEELIQKISRWI